MTNKKGQTTIYKTFLTKKEKKRATGIPPGVNSGAPEG
jgi:hypothetical protein